MISLQDWAAVYDVPHLESRFVSPAASRLTLLVPLLDGKIGRD